MLLNEHVWSKFLKKMTFYSDLDYYQFVENTELGFDPKAIQHPSLIHKTVKWVSALDAGFSSSSSLVTIQLGMYTITMCLCQFIIVKTLYDSGPATDYSRYFTDHLKLSEQQLACLLKVVLDL